MTIYAANGAKLYIGGPLASKSTDFVLADYAAQTSLWTEIGETEGLGSLGDTSAEITFQGISANRDRRLKGTRNAGTMEVVCALDYADAGQVDLLAAEKARGEYAFKLVLADAPAPVSSTVTITIASPGVVSWAAHTLVNGMAVRFSTTGALPTGLTAGTTYYVVNAAAGTFQVAATVGGSAIVTSGTQSGTHTAVTVPSGSQRYFVASVASVVEALDAANNVMKLQTSLWVNSNIVKVDAA